MKPHIYKEPITLNGEGMYFAIGILIYSTVAILLFVGVAMLTYSKSAMQLDSYSNHISLNQPVENVNILKNK